MWKLAPILAHPRPPRILRALIWALAVRRSAIRGARVATLLVSYSTETVKTVNWLKPFFYAKIKSLFKSVFSQTFNLWVFY